MSKAIRMTERERLGQLRAFVDLCFASLDDDLKEVANQTGLCVATLRRLKYGKLTLLVRFGTVQALGMAAGYRMEMQKTRVRMFIIRKGK